MLRYKTYFLLLFLSCICSGMVADNTDDEDLLRKLDGMIEQREVYQRKVEKEIADLRRTLTYAEDDKLQFDILGNLFAKYRSFRIDTAMVVAKERLRLAEKLKDEELINQGLMNVADVLNKMG